VATGKTSKPLLAKTLSLRTDRPRIGCIGMRYQGTVIALKASAHGDVVAVCDVDRNVLEQARASFGSTPAIYEDYRDMLARDDIDVVTIGAPDHWHAKMLIDACRAGKDVYCEKPLTLTIDEGKLIRDVVRDTKRVVQVGSWQRSDERFRTAVEMVRRGLIGELQRVDVVLGKNEQGGPFQPTPPPPSLNWNLWQGQTPDVPYIPERSHGTFRWWYEYSGGQLSDWGAHHLDIAQWAIGEYPAAIESAAILPNVSNGYNVPTDFAVTYHYPSGVVMKVMDTGRNGIMFHGSEGRIFVNREALAGKPVDYLAQRPLWREKFTLYEFDNLDRPPRSGKLDAIINHMGNFFDCVASRRQPISDIESQHRSVTTCHLGNISIWLGRAVNWDAAAERFVKDAEADRHLSREQRAGFEVA
jgi:predicted dehydrogenase